MSDVGPYGYLQNASDQGVTANQMVGERAGSVTGNAMLTSSAPAFLSTAPYRPPLPRGQLREDRSKMCRGKDDTCRAFRVKGTEWCIFHQPDEA